jgi:hypothetical protein
VLRDHGLTFCYHNHGYEFTPHDSGTVFDLIVQRTNPAAVSFELDVLWAHFPGQDPAQLLDRYPERFRLMHLKDLRRGVVGDLTGHTAPENDVALGGGQLDLPRILRSARSTRIEHYYIEDESPDFRPAGPTQPLLLGFAPYVELTAHHEVISVATYAEPEVHRADRRRGDSPRSCMSVLGLWMPDLRVIGPGGQGGGSEVKNARMSSASSLGSSWAGKWPPRGGVVHLWTR